MIANLIRNVGSFPNDNFKQQRGIRNKIVFPRAIVLNEIANNKIILNNYQTSFLLLLSICFSQMKMCYYFDSTR